MHNEAAPEKTSLGKQELFWFIISLILVVITTTVSYNSFRNYRDNVWWVVHTHEVKQSLESLLSFLKDAETGQRGYLITGEEAYLDPYTTALKNIDSQVHKLKDLTNDNQVQQQRIPSLENLIALKTSELNETITLRRAHGFAAARTVVITNSGKNIMDRIREIMQGMYEEEDSLLKNRSLAEHVSTSYFYSIIFLLFAISLISFYLLRRYISARNRADADMRRFNVQLEDALNQVKELRGIIRICSHCKRICNDANDWEQLESYITNHTDALFSHGICPACQKQQ